MLPYRIFAFLHSSEFARLVATPNQWRGHLSGAAVALRSAVDDDNNTADDNGLFVLPTDVAAAAAVAVVVVAVVDEPRSAEPVVRVAELCVVGCSVDASSAASPPLQP